MTRGLFWRGCCALHFIVSFFVFKCYLVTIFTFNWLLKFTFYFPHWKKMIWGIQRHQLPIVSESELSFCFVHHTSCPSNTLQQNAHEKSSSCVSVHHCNNLGGVRYIKYYLQRGRNMCIQTKKFPSPPGAE